MSAVWHRPPTIAPNYGKKKSMLPKSNLSQVLLHDNASQQQLLDSRLSHISVARKRSGRLLDLHRKSFIVRQSVKQQHLREAGINHVGFLPESVARAHFQLQRSSSVSSDRSSASLSRAFTARERLADDCSEMAGVLGSSRGVLAENGGGEFAVNGRGDLVGNRSELSVNGWGHSRSNLVVNSSRHHRMDRLSGNGWDVAEGEPMTPAALAEEGVQSSINFQIPSIESNSNKNHMHPAQNHSNHRKSFSAFPAPKLGLQSPSKAFTTYDFRLRREQTFATSCSRSTRDPRFLGLEKSLIRSDKPTDGFLQLSPSGSDVIQRYGRPLYDPKALRRRLQEYNGVEEDESIENGVGRLGVANGLHRMDSLSSMDSDDRDHLVEVSVLKV